ncbi:hypothetical protein BCF59_0177 [Mycoplasmopsis mustelae]|uniref:Uncharacterized protein n=1 Tax=Mycoplasmopsis mustelae TaxID=171289 RepID=A0A4R7UF22_9BACT|nr:hypothetical protein [Mycoplasmopsis mustelae]TDV24225.1 hypothetical protein BCF59_0177 [Mycoplasmopsis mustelae]
MKRFLTLSKSEENRKELPEKNSCSADQPISVICKKVNKSKGTVIKYLKILKKS